MSPSKLEKQLLAIAREQGFKGDNLRSNPLLMRCMIAVWEVKGNERAKRLDCEECGGFGQTVGFEGQKKIRFDCESCSGHR